VGARVAAPRLSALARNVRVGWLSPLGNDRSDVLPNLVPHERLGARDEGRKRGVMPRVPRVVASELKVEPCLAFINSAVPR
jgi:hypothetical protein